MSMHSQRKHTACVFMHAIDSVNLANYITAAANGGSAARTCEGLIALTQQQSGSFKLRVRSWQVLVCALTSLSCEQSDAVPMAPLPCTVMDNTNVKLAHSLN